MNLKADRPHDFGAPKEIIILWKINLRQKLTTNKETHTEKEKGHHSFQED